MVLLWDLLPSSTADGHLHLLEDQTFGCNVSQAPRHFTGSFPAPALLCVTVAPVTLQL